MSPSQPAPFRSPIASMTVGLLLSATGALAWAGQVDVTVRSSDGRPVANVAVTVQQTGPSTSRPVQGIAVMRQKQLRFEPSVMVVPLGTTLRFTNEDSYDHHVRSLPGGPAGNVPPARSFDLRLPSPQGDKIASADVPLEAPGVITVGCHIHGSMRGHVLVSATPWVGVTDADGKVSISGVPEGEVDVRLWHPEQLVDQAVQRARVGAAPVAVTAPLNFRPATRRPASPTTNPYSQPYQGG